MNTNTFTRRLRIAGVLILLGLAMQAVALVWHHPLAFLFFCGGGDACMVVGIVMYFWFLLGYTSELKRLESESLPVKS